MEPRRGKQDAFSELANNGKGTAGVSVNPNAKPDTSIAVDDHSSRGSGGGEVKIATPSSSESSAPGETPVEPREEAAE